MNLLRNVHLALMSYLGRNAALYFLSFLTLSVGVVAGALGVNLLSDPLRQELVGYVESMFVTTAEEGISMSGPIVLEGSITAHLKNALLLWLSGATIIGIPFAFVILFLRGFVLGFTVGFFVQLFGYKGILFSFFTVLPANLLAVPAFVGIGACSMAFVLRVFNRRNKRLHFYFQELLCLTIFTVLLAGPLILASLIEAYLTPAFIEMLSPYFKI